MMVDTTVPVIVLSRKRYTRSVNSGLIEYVAFLGFKAFIMSFLWEEIIRNSWYDLKISFKSLQIDFGP